MAAVSKTLNAPGAGPDSQEPDPTTRLRAVIGRLSRRLRPTVAGSGLTPSQISVLFTIVRLGPLGLSELAEIESLNPTMLSRITAQLCRRWADRALGRPRATGAPRSSRRPPPAGASRERIHRERTQALAAHIEELDERQREALWEALPVLEELAERLPGGRAMTRLLGVGRVTFAALAIPNYRRYIAGQSVSLIGTWMQMAAQSWLVLTLTGSATTLGCDRRPADAAGAAARPLRRRDRRPRRQAPADGRAADRDGRAGADPRRCSR